jgi:hypothetical protein
MGEAIMSAITGVFGFTRFSSFKRETRTNIDRLEDKFFELNRRLQSIQNERSADEAAPSRFAIEWGARILSQLRDIEFLPDRLVTSAEGGIALCFIRDAKYADIEVLNSKEIVAVTSNRKDQPRVWTVPETDDGIFKTVVTIRDYFRGA